MNRCLLSLALFLALVPACGGDGPVSMDLGSSDLNTVDLGDDPGSDLGGTDVLRPDLGTDESSPVDSGLDQGGALDSGTDEAGADAVGDLPTEDVVPTDCGPHCGEMVDAEPCIPDCTGRECGPDPVCGASCGTCGSRLECGLDGSCTPVARCQDLPETWGPTTVVTNLQTPASGPESEGVCFDISGDGSGDNALGVLAANVNGPFTQVVSDGGLVLLFEFPDAPEQLGGTFVLNGLTGVPSEQGLGPGGAYLVDPISYGSDCLPVNRFPEARIDARNLSATAPEVWIELSRIGRSSGTSPGGTGAVFLRLTDVRLKAWMVAGGLNKVVMIDGVISGVLHREDAERALVSLEAICGESPEGEAPLLCAGFGLPLDMFAALIPTMLDLRDDGDGSYVAAGSGVTPNAMSVCLTFSTASAFVEGMVPTEPPPECFDDPVGSCKAVYACMGECLQGSAGDACRQLCIDNLSADGLVDYQAFDQCVQTNCGSVMPAEEFLACVDANCKDEYYGCFWGCTYATCASLIDCLTACPEGDSDCGENCWVESTPEAQMVLNDAIACQQDACPVCSVGDPTPDQEAECETCWADAASGTCKSYWGACTDYGVGGCADLWNCFIACPDNTCAQACVDVSSMEAQGLMVVVIDCLEAHCDAQTLPEDPLVQCLNAAIGEGGACKATLDACLADTGQS